MFNKAMILSDNSLEEIRTISAINPISTYKPLSELIIENSLALVESEYLIAPGTSLMMPEGNNWEENKDRENALIVYGALKNFKVSYASDERFWVTLAFGEFFEYTKKRWQPVNESKEEISKSLRNHWFAPTSRSRWRDQSISRLWWVGHFAHSIPGLEADKVLDVLYLNSELVNSFLGHPRTISSKRLSAILLSLFHDHYFKYPKTNFNREQFRLWMHLIDLRGGKINFDTLEDEYLRAEIVNIMNKK
jgi:hypothetical protein